jgi:phytoene dehydrogenase-like protein
MIKSQKIPGQMNKRACVVGAGLSGLACAVELKKHGFEVDVYEKSSNLGGRVQTEKYDGFLLDHGFQVYLPSYEMGQYFFDYEKLCLKSFSAGAQVFNDGKFELMSDPLREPSGFIATLSSKLGSLKDKVLILKLKIAASKPNQKISLSKSTASYLIDFGFSKKFIENFFTPFFGGVFLEKDLRTSRSFFLYLFNKFAESEASVPEKGMGELSLQLASSLNQDEVFLNTDVSAADSSRVQLSDGSEKKYDFVIVATTPDSTNNLLGTAYETDFNSTNTYYFKTKSNASSGKKLYLNSSKDRVVNHVACMSAVNSKCAPDGWHLFSVTTIGAEDFDVASVTLDLAKIFGEKEINTWQHLKTFKVKQALPSKPLYSNTVLKKDGVFICGDFTESPSIQGALSSGYQVALEISKLS